jgi:hydrogenase-4 component F
VGLPPFGLFVSEFLLVQAAVAERRFSLAAVVLALLLTAFISLIGHLNRMLYGEAPAGTARGERAGWPVVALIVPAAILVVLGVALPGPLATLIQQSVGNLLR